MQVLCPEDVIGFRYYSSEHPQIRRCSMHLSGASVFPEHDPWVPNVNLSVVKWLPCDVLTKIHLVPNAGMLFGQVTLRHPSPAWVALKLK
jgi:hypothetical protein